MSADAFERQPLLILEVRDLFDGPEPGGVRAAVEKVGVEQRRARRRRLTGP